MFEKIKTLNELNESFLTFLKNLSTERRLKWRIQIAGKFIAIGNHLRTLFEVLAAVSIPMAVADPTFYAPNRADRAQNQNQPKG